MANPNPISISTTIQIGTRAKKGVGGDDEGFGKDGGGARFRYLPASKIVFLS